MFKRIISLTVSAGLLLQQTVFAYTASLNLSNYLSQASNPIVSDRFRPISLRYFSYQPLTNDYKILLDKGDFAKGLSPQGTVPDQERLKETAGELMRYFLIGVTLPNDKFWVNLRPDSEDQIIDDELARTDLGKVMLEADLKLKQDTALFTSPKTPQGKAYWDKLYQRAGELFGTENITIPTLTRPWIVPGEIIVRESGDSGSTSLTTSAYVYKAGLKVMLEEDYIKSQVTGHRSQVNLEQYSFNDQRLKELNEYSTQLIRELILPKLTQKVNSSKDYAKLRQVYFSLILARWFKEKYQGETRNQSTETRENSYIKLIDSRNLTNLSSKQAWDKTTYFQAYQKSFKEGEYNLSEPVYTPTGQVIRRYMSGGTTFNNMPKTGYIADSPIVAGDNKAFFIGDQLNSQNPTAAEISSASPIEQNKGITEYWQNYFKDVDLVSSQSTELINKAANFSGEVGPEVAVELTFSFKLRGAYQRALDIQNEKNIGDEEKFKGIHSLITELYGTTKHKKFKDTLDNLDKRLPSDGFSLKDLEDIIKKPIKDVSDGMAKRAFENAANENNVILMILSSEGFVRDALEESEAFQANEAIVPEKIKSELGEINEAIANGKNYYRSKSGELYPILDAIVDVIEGTNAFVTNLGGKTLAEISDSESGATVALVFVPRGLGNVSDSYAGQFVTNLGEHAENFKKQTVTIQGISYSLRDPELYAKDPAKIIYYLEYLANIRNQKLSELEEEIVLMARPREEDFLDMLKEIKERESIKGLEITEIIDGTVAQGLKAAMSKEVFEKVFQRPYGTHKTFISVGGAPEIFMVHALAARFPGAVSWVRIFSANMNVNEKGAKVWDKSQRYEGFKRIPKGKEVIESEEILRLRPDAKDILRGRKVFFEDDLPGALGVFTLITPNGVFGGEGVRDDPVKGTSIVNQLTIKTEKGQEPVVVLESKEVPWAASSAIMANLQSMPNLLEELRKKGITLTKDGIEKIDHVVLDEFIKEDLEVLVRDGIALNTDRKAAQAISRILVEIGESVGINTSSLHDVYRARLVGDILQNTTLPATNIRGMTFDVMVAEIEVQMENNGTVIFELARSEEDYTEQKLWEYAAMVYAAALKAGYRGKIFLKLDHAQVKKELYFGMGGKEANPQKAIQDIMDLIKRAIDAGFLNIDIDPSSLAITANLKDATNPELKKLGLDNLSTLNEEDALNSLSDEEILRRQTFNLRETVELIKYVRKIEEQYNLPLTIALGGEDMHVDQRVLSTARSVGVFTQAIEKELAKIGIEEGKGLIVFSIQSGTKHGGITIAGVPVGEEGVTVNFEALKEIADLAKEGKLGSTIAVSAQHGASTLPKKNFDLFPLNKTGEVHLATEIQNIILAATRKLSPVQYQQLNRAMIQSKLWIKEGKPGEIQTAIKKHLQDYYHKAYGKKIEEAELNNLFTKAVEVVEAQGNWVGFTEGVIKEVKELKGGQINKDLDQILRFAIAEAFYRSYKNVFGLTKNMFWNLDKLLKVAIKKAIKEYSTDIFMRLGFANTKTEVDTVAKVVPINHIPRPQVLVDAVAQAASALSAGSQILVISNIISLLEGAQTGGYNAELAFLDGAQGGIFNHSERRKHLEVTIENLLRSIQHRNAVLSDSEKERFKATLKTEGLSDEEMNVVLSKLFYNKLAIWPHTVIHEWRYSEANISFDDKVFERVKRGIVNYIMNLQLKKVIAYSDKYPVRQTVLCIGETKSQYDAKRTQEILRQDLEEILEDIGLGQEKKIGLRVAYEPRWAIGTGLTPTADEIQAAHRFIKDTLSEILGIELEVDYGGSLNKNNAHILSLPDVDGGLIGTAAKTPGDIKPVIDEAIKQGTKKGKLLNIGLNWKAEDKTTGLARLKDFSALFETINLSKVQIAIGTPQVRTVKSNLKLRPLSSSSILTAVLSPGVDKLDSTLGGIDLTKMKMLIQPQGSLASSSLDFSLPMLSQAELESFDLDQELTALQRMASSGIDPNPERLKAALAVCFALGRTGREIDRLKSCLEDVFEHQQLEAKETPDGYKEVLVVADTRSYVLKEGRFAASGQNMVSLN